MGVNRSLASHELARGIELERFVRKEPLSHDRPGRSITLTSGMIGHRPRKGTAVMAAGGSAVEHLTAGLAMDLAPVRVNAGYVRTEQVKRMPEGMLKC